VVPSPGNVLLEGDYKAHEARNIGMASQDVELIRQTVAKIDIHKKWAGNIWNIAIDQVSSAQKYSSKNGFVFPSIYGSKPKSISKHLGVSIDLIVALQDEFWAEFTGVREWQRNLIRFYNENGYVEGLTGYRCYGPLTAYQIFNYPIQGMAFHFLLAAMIEVDNILIKGGFKTQLINEVHDAMVFDAHPDEVKEVVCITTEAMCRKRWDWQNVPLDVSWEIGPNWWKMEEYDAVHKV
jgi:DNA polymerase-1